ncbi:MAG: M56 family metallopeptidase, partial [Planctomycetota bacterium]
MPESRLSVFNLIPQSIPQRQTEYVRQKISDESLKSDIAIEDTEESVPTSTTTAKQEIRESVTPRPVVKQQTKSRPKTKSFKLADILSLVWLTGAVLLTLYVCASNFNLLRIVKRRRPVTDQKILDLLEDCKSQMRIRTILGVVVTDKVKSPALFGFVRPRLLLPQGMVESLTHEELRYVLLHELAHLKRHDIYIGWLMSLLQILHWFNPLIWLAFYRMRADRELACDALVLSRTQSDESKSYGRIIVNLLERFSRSQPLPAMAGILENKSELKRRITMIAKFKKDSYQWSPLGIILIIIIACVSVPNAISTKASRISAKEPMPPIMLRRIWAGPGVGITGAPSPDGRYLSYVDWDTGDPAVYEIANGTKRRLTNEGSWDEPYEFAQFSRWSPDGKQIVYDWYNKDDFIELRIVGLDASKPRILYSNEEVVWAKTYDWSPDGKQILACFSRKDSPAQIVLVSAADGSVRVLKTLNRYPQSMGFSPDGRYIVYDFPQKEDSPEHNISVLLIDGSREIPLIKHPADDRVLGWTPDGKHILFASDRTGSPDIWVIRITEGNPQDVPELVKPIKGPFPPLGLGFTRDGSFYYGHRPNRTNVYIAEIDPVTGKIVVPPHEAINRFVESNGTPDYSPDGKYLAYVSRRPPMPTRYTTNPIGNVLCIRSLETGEEREFRPEINKFGWPRWSPDGRS